MINHAEDRVIIVDDSLVPLLARVAADLKAVETYIVVETREVTIAPSQIRFLPPITELASTIT